VGAGVGKAGIPDRWLDDLWEFPGNISWMEKLGHRLAEAIDTNTKQSPISIPVHLVYLRNLIFLSIVIYHGFRRCLP
jgi:ADP-ribosyl-[dinitrogen reductase] hydrolase